jgi:hypothetical protein
VAGDKRRTSNRLIESIECINDDTVDLESRLDLFKRRHCKQSSVSNRQTPPQLTIDKLAQLSFQLLFVQSFSDHYLIYFDLIGVQKSFLALIATVKTTFYSSKERQHNTNLIFDYEPSQRSSAKFKLKDAKKIEDVTDRV